MVRVRVNEKPLDAQTQEGKSGCIAQEGHGPSWI